MQVTLDDALSKTVSNLAGRLNCSESHALARLLSYGMLCVKKIDQDGMIIVASSGGRTKIKKDW